jgi:two-component system, OmpR family, phosphate regulon sensor histidine kinase PhoR
VSATGSSASDTALLTSRFLWQLWLTLAGTVVISTLVFGFVTARQLEVDTRNAIQSNLQVQSTILQRYLAPLLTADRVVESKILLDLTNGLENRVTLIDATGRVLADSKQDPLVMDNHLSRPEITQARSEPFGVSERYSETLKQTMLYVASDVNQDGVSIGFVRVAMPLSIIQSQLAELRSQIFVSAALITLVCLLFGFYLYKRITQPIIDMTGTAERMTRGQYDLRIAAERKDEIGKLSSALNELASGTEQRIRDLTSGRNELAAILAGLNEGVIAVDLNERIVHINDAALGMLNLSSEDLQSPDIGQIVHSNEIGRAVNVCLREQMAVTLSVQSEENDLEVSVSPLGGVDDDNVPVGAIVVLQDVTEFLHLEKVRSDFVANASHELKTPISAIRGLSETILDDPLMEKEFMDRFLNRIRSQAIRLDNIVQDLIHLSRFDSSNRDIDLKAVDLCALTRQVYRTKIDDAQDRGVALSLSVSDENITVPGESEALDQMLVNLVDNAIKYSERDAGKVELRLSQLGSAALIEVEDNGIGIPKEEQQRVFERFYRVDKGRSREQGGTGLGLSIVKHIARTHHGEVTLTSDANKGCLFSIRLPLSV